MLQQFLIISLENVSPLTGWQTDKTSTLYSNKPIKSTTLNLPFSNMPFERYLKKESFDIPHLIILIPNFNTIKWHFKVVSEKNTESFNMTWCMDLLAEGPQCHLVSWSSLHALYQVLTQIHTGAFDKCSMSRYIRDPLINVAFKCSRVYLC